MSDLIKKWNELLERKTLLSKEEKQLKKEMKEAGFVFVGNKFVENKETWGLFWDMVYCSHYVGEHGMYTDQAKGSTEIDYETYQRVQELLGDLESEENIDSLTEILSAFIPFEDYVLSNRLSYGKVTVKDDHVKWVTTQAGTNDGQMRRGSFFEINKTTLKDIHAIKYVYEEDVLD